MIDDFVVARFAVVDLLVVARRDTMDQAISLFSIPSILLLISNVLHGCMT